MIDFLNRDSKSWESVGDYLQSDEIKLLSSEDRDRLFAEWKDIGRLERAIDDALLIGIVGGTGVGKSTFINALAGEKVSRSSDRRPTTDRVVVYRHNETELPDDVPLADLAQPQVLHKRDALEKVVLFDFPDFDSAERKHANIIQNYLEYLDVLLIVVDDVKYADRRLYELLTSLGQSADNLFVLLNKVDRLEKRYADSTEKVIKELVLDIQDKMQVNANLSLRVDQLYPISAGEVLNSRCEDKPTDLLQEFLKVEELLAGFQEGKYLRRIKEQNIDTRKERLSSELAAAALGEENQSILRETTRLVDNWQEELDSALRAIPEDLLLERERKGLRKSRLRKASRNWGLPFSLIFTLMGEMPWSKGAESLLSQNEMGARIHQHYRGFFEAARNLQSRFRSEFAGSKISQTNLVDAQSLKSQADQSTEQWSSRMAEKAIGHIQSQARTPRRWTRFLWHLPAVGVVVMAIWTRIAPILESLTGEGNFFISLAKAFFGMWNPMFIVGILIGVIIAYLIASLILWLREVQSLDSEIGTAESIIRKDVRIQGDAIVEGLRDNVELLSTEYSGLQQLLGEVVDLDKSNAT